MWVCTDCWQRFPGLVTRGKEGEASWTFDLIPELGSIRVHLSGGGTDHTQSAVDVHKRQRCNGTHKQTQLMTLCSKIPTDVLNIFSVRGQRSYPQDSPSLRESSHNQGSTHRWSPCREHIKTQENMRILVDLLVFPDVRAEASCRTSCFCFSIKLSASTSGACDSSVVFLLQDTHKLLKVQVVSWNEKKRAPVTNQPLPDSTKHASLSRKTTASAKLKTHLCLLHKYFAH